MNNMNYSSYSPFTPSLSPKEDELRLGLRQEFIKQYAADNNYVDLKCDYFGKVAVDRYYYDKKNKIMYKVCIIFSDTDKSITPTFQVCNDEHVLKLNGI